MTREGFDRLLGPIRRPVARKIKGKEFEQVITFVNIIDGELEQFVKEIKGDKSSNKVKRLNHQFLTKLKTH
jgi:hypothetical protein